MFDLIYVAFFFLMVAEMVLFLFLNLPFPKSWKKGIFVSLADSSTAPCALPAGHPVLRGPGPHREDLLRGQEQAEEQNYNGSRYVMRDSELRRERLSYQIIKIQRNKYVSFIVVFTFLANLVFFWIKNKRYALEHQHQSLVVSGQSNF